MTYKITNNNAVKRAILELCQSMRYEYKMEVYEGNEIYIINECVSVSPLMRKWRNLITDEMGDILPFTAKAEVMKIIRQEIQKSRQSVIDKHQLTLI